MTRYRIILYLMTMLLLSACDATPPKVSAIGSPNEVITPTLAQTLPTLVSTFNLPTDTPSPSPVPSQPLSTETSTPIPVSTADPNTRLRTECLKSVATLPENAKLEGTIVLSSDMMRYSLLDLETMNQIPLVPVNQDVFGVNISPNGKHMVYTYCSDTSCSDTIATMDGVITTIPHSQEWRNIRWLDNERLVIAHDREPYNTVVVLNPFSGNEVELSLDLPNPYHYVTADDKRILLSAIDPTLKRVVYFDEEGNGRIILWDIQAGKILAWLTYPMSEDAPSIDYRSGWSPDGSQFIIVSPVTYSDPEGLTPAAEELFSIDLDGQVRQLTDLNTGYGFVRISQYRWSPDGRYIAFWLQTAEDAKSSPADLIQRLAVLDTITLEITDYCIPYSSDPEYSLAIMPPVWAPNSEQLVVYTRSENGKYLVTLVDFGNGFTAKITDDLIPEGWMIAP